MCTARSGGLADYRNFILSHNNSKTVREFYLFHLYLCLVAELADVVVSFIFYIIARSRAYL